MSAAIRYAVRRLGGQALQPAQANYAARLSTAVEEVQRRLLRTVLPTSSRRSATSGVAQSPTINIRHPCAKSAAAPLDEKTKEYIVRTHLNQIQQTKEELYHLIGDLESRVPSRCSRENIGLLRDLSAQIEPKPNDSQWRWYRGAKRFDNCLRYSGFLGFSCIPFLLTVSYSEQYLMFSNAIMKIGDFFSV